MSDGDCNVDDKVGNFFGSWGANTLEAFGFNSGMFPTKENNRNKTLTDLQNQLQMQIFDSQLEWAKAENDVIEATYNDFKSSISVIYTTMSYYNTMVQNQIKLEQITIIGAYLLFLILYCYLIYFT